MVTSLVAVQSVAVRIEWVKVTLISGRSEFPDIVMNIDDTESSPSRLID